jgi:hypothetical protein
MATKEATKPTAEVVEVKATPVGAVSTSRLAMLAEQAKQAAAAERPSLSKISLKGGIVSYGGAPVKDNRLDVIVLAATYRNTFYAGRYDPNNIKNPTCFALAVTDEGMVPYGIVTDPVSPACDGCPNREWGSDLNGGRGKACKETRRLVLLPATVLEDADPVSAIKTGELAIVDLPVTSVKHYSNYVNVLASSIGLPAWACVTEISVLPNAKTQFEVNFRGIRSAGDTDALLDALEARIADATRIGLIGYDSVDDGEDDAEASSPKPAGKAKKF